MDRFSRLPANRIVLSILTGFACLAGSITPISASDPAANPDATTIAKGLARMKNRPKIDCIMPDGRLVSVPLKGETNACTPALITDDDILRCPLQEGETTFIISFSETSLLDRFTFVNENGSVQGVMRIAVSNCPLPVNSPEWTEVSGKTAFVSKRLFNLSMVGVEASFVKLSFQVEKGNQIASLDRFDGIVP